MSLPQFRDKSGRRHEKGITMARLEQMLEMVKKDRDVRQNLIQIRQNISDESLRRNFIYILGGDFTILTDLLEHEDPKVRRNAALILGQTEDEDVLPALLKAWEKEETLYIREDYLKAVSMLDYREYLPKLRKRIEELERLSEQEGAASPELTYGQEEASSSPSSQEDGEAVWDNSKHLISELSRLRLLRIRSGQARSLP